MPEPPPRFERALPWLLGLVVGLLGCLTAWNLGYTPPDWALGPASALVCACVVAGVSWLLWRDMRR